MSNVQSFKGVPGSYRRAVLFRPVLVFIAGLILTTVLLYVAVNQSIGPNYGEGFRMLSQLQEDIFSKASIIYTITVFIIVSGIIFLTLLYSHRVAGPVYRLTHFARALSSGDFSSNVYIRDNDVIHPLADEMNAMVDQYRQALGRLQVEMNALEKIAAQVAEGKDEDVVWGEIEESSGKIVSELERYRL
ncbi:MAG: methyl-accepting chemotaxis protein [Desulfobulbaceae bacterium]|uniref:Methyl-accepting chemotaxis protein n=1 Tax=Candidatus Desulfobia pelagia TaxID=2841692 RepID=A0A8J6TGB6_9BACT|nr:methyl-accepting chemotaxis protein [Candidatus Desulfobia pelagia]